MNTQELVTFVEAKTNETRPVIVSLLNEIQKFVYKKPMAQTTYYDPNNFGLPPFMATTNNIYRYTFPDGTYTMGGNNINVFRTIAILSLSTTATYGNQTAGYMGRNPTYNLGGQTFTNWPINQKDRTVGNPAEFTFRNVNPGTSTNIYYHLFTIAPTEIVSETVDLTLPEGTHLAIATGIISLLKSETYGDESAFEYWKNKIANEVWQEMNQGEQNRAGATLPQLKDRNYQLSTWGYRSANR